MKNLVTILIVIIFLSGGLAAATYASYNGYGLVAAGTSPSARTGSLGGPIILGGGPGSGK
jgi:hypothetical protein